LQSVWVFIARKEWEKAEALLDTLLAGKPWDKKILFTKAQLRKRMWIASEREDYQLMMDALHLFSRCHLLTGNPEAGINTATLLLLSGNHDEARKKAEEIATRCRNLVMKGNRELDGYFAAVIAEANLIMGRLEAAEAWYDTAYSKDNSVTEIFSENMSLILEHIVPESGAVARIRKALRA
jgi:tetratricopeptide (TPR) repeat protein